jgi:hypothetical protein
MGKEILDHPVIHQITRKELLFFFFAYFTLKKMSKVKASSMAEFGLSLPKLVLGASHKREINFGFLF